MWSQCHGHEACVCLPGESSSQSPFKPDFGLHQLLREISGSLAAQLLSFGAGCVANSGFLEFLC